ncbi:MAG: hypothetical protein ACOYJC_03090 [Christensenellales bacterium]
MEYTVQVASGPLNGEVKLVIEDNGISMSTLFDAHHIAYVDIRAFEIRNYTIHMMTETGIFTFARLGSLNETFFDELYAAYNKKVRKALFVEGAPLFHTQGNYRYAEYEKTAEGTAFIEIYENCVLILPPDDGARRIPLCFTCRLDQADFGVSLEQDTGERYTFSRLGHDARTFSECIEKRLHILRENSMNAVRNMDATLNAQQIAAIAKLMPEGAAAPMNRLYEIAPSFIKALESNISQSRVAIEYQVFKENCDPMRICVGMGSHLSGEEAENVLWLIAPAKKSDVAAVEFATSEDTAAATFLYRTGENWDMAWRKLNHAIEAMQFKREVIRLKDEELRRPEYADYAMAIARNDALQFIRRHFSGRVIHSSPQRWKQELLSYMV